MRTTEHSASSRSSSIACLKQLMVVALGVSGLMCTNLVNALEIKPSLRLGAAITDNATEASSGRDAEGILVVTPGLRLSHQGRNVQLSLDYDLQSLTYLRESGRNSINHGLKLDGRFHAIRDKLGVDVSASIDQQVVDPAERVSLDNFTANGNRSDVERVAVSPFWRGTVGNWVNYNTRLQLSQFWTESGNISSSQFRGWQAGVSSGTDFDRWDWGVTYSNSLNSRDSDSNSFSETFRGQLAWWWYERFAPAMIGGYEDHRFNGIDTARSGRFLAVGFQSKPVDRMTFSYFVGNDHHQAAWSWAPSRRTVAQVSYRDPRVGQITRPSWSARFVHRQRRSTFQASYQESVTNNQASSAQILNSAFGGNAGLAGALLNTQFSDGDRLPVNGGTIDANAAQDSVQSRFNQQAGILSRQDVFSRQLELSWNYRGRRDSFLARLHDERRRSLLRSDQRISGISFAYDRHLSRSLDFGTGLRLLSRALSDSGRRNFWVGEVRLRRRLGQHVSADLEYRHSRDADGSDGSYHENRLSLFFNIQM